MGEFAYPPSLPGRKGRADTVSVADMSPNSCMVVFLEDRVVAEGDDAGLDIGI